MVLWGAIEDATNEEVKQQYDTKCICVLNVINLKIKKKYIK